MSEQPHIFTCISCQVAFQSPESQRAHYKTDWHRYNLKRKVVNLPPVTFSQFNEKAEGMYWTKKKERKKYNTMNYSS